MLHRLAWLSVFVFAVASAASAQSWQSDPTFAPVLESSWSASSDLVFAVPGGKVLVRPQYAINGVVATSRVVRLNPDGTLDPAFSPPSGGFITPLAVYPDGRLLIQSTVTDASNGRRRGTVLRLHVTGLQDDAFSPVVLSHDASARARLLPDGRVILFGDFSTLNDSPQKHLAMLSADGSPDSAFRPPVFSIFVLGEVAPLPSGQMMIAGPFTALGASGLNRLARLNADGSVDSAFNANAVTASFAPTRVYVRPDASVLVASGAGELIRLTAEGARDSTFVPQFVGSQRMIGDMQRDGKIVYFESGARPTLRRLNPDGTPDLSLALTGPFYGISQILLPVLADDGSLFINMAVTEARYRSRAVVTRLRTDGTIDPAFAPRFSSRARVDAFARQADDKLIVAGNFDRVNGTVVASADRTAIVRLNPDGSLDPSFAGSLAINETITRLGLQPDGKVIVSGGFLFGEELRHVIRLNPNGSRDLSFQPSDNVSNVWVDGAGNLYSTPLGVAPRIQRYTPEGKLDESFRSEVAAGRFVPLSDGAVLVVSGTTLLRLRSDGSADPDFKPDRDVLQGDIFGVVPLPNGRALICAQVNARFGVSMRLHGITRTGAIDYKYLSQDNYTNQLTHADHLIVAWAMFEALRSANASAGDVVEGEWIGPGHSGSFVVDGSGRLTVLSRWFAENEFEFTRYQWALPPDPNAALKPVIISQGTPLPNRPLGYPVTVGGVTVGGLYPLFFQWSKNGVPIIGANSATFPILEPQASDAGDYVLSASNAYGSVVSNPIPVSFNPVQFRPVILRQPTSVTAHVGHSATFEIEVRSNPASTFQWEHNGAPISGATNATLTVNNVQPESGGSYAVRIGYRAFNNNGSFSATDRSAAATLTVNAFDFAGTYFGKIGAEGGKDDFALTFRADGTASIVIHLASAQRVAVATSFKPTTNGTFTSNARVVNGTTADVMALTGAFATDGTVTGTLGSLAFSGTKATGSGRTGFFQAPCVGITPGVLYAIVGPDRRTFVVAAMVSGAVESSTGTLAADGRLSVTSGGSLVSDVVLDTQAGTLMAGAQDGPFSGRRFLGMRYDVASTDRLANISTRGRAGSAENALIAGFVVSGGASSMRQVLIRAIGPSLADFGVGNVLTDPRLALYRGNTKIGESDNWGSEPYAEAVGSATGRVGAFPLRQNTKDAVLVATLPPGNYTAQVSSGDDSAAVALVEVYEIAQESASRFVPPRLANIATRGHVGGGEDMLIAGIAITGNLPKRVLIRAVGPTLVTFGLADPLADPFLTLLSGADPLATNDNWAAGGAGASAAEIAAAAVATGAFPLPADSRDAALLVTLPPGNYTAQISSRTGATGLAMVEVYELVP